MPLSRCLKHGPGGQRDDSLQFFVASDGARIATRRWKPHQRPRGAVLMLHGMGEHSGRYGHVAEHLCRGGYAAWGMDFRGHGLSAGRRGDTRMTPVLEDVDVVVAELAASVEAPVFLYGHSLGGLVALLYALEPRPALSGVIATAPALHTVLREQRLKVFVACKLGRLAPSLTIPSGLDVTALNRDPEVVRAYRADALVHSKASLGFACDALAAIERVLSEAGSLSLPLLLVHGGDDRVTRISGSEQLVRAASGDTRLLVLDGAFHSVEHEPEHGRMLDEVLAWMGSLVAGRT